MAGGLDQSAAQKILASTTVSAAFSTLSAVFMCRLNSTLSTGAAAGTQITNGTGYVTNGQTSTAPFASTATTAVPSVVTIPHTAVLTWAVTGANFAAIASLDITDGTATFTRQYWGPFTGQPIAVANGNTFQIALDAISISLQ
jgi:cytochrome bd-type quinol oxidase subunit 1